MSKSKIEKPKVFISYAWGAKDYQDKVLSFATDLMKIGIEVELDKWTLKAGNDTYAFMEQCVTDPSITNVLILLDEQYAVKADSRSGGVGTETQIISPEIYSKVKQEKFIPIVFERDIDGKIHKPAYLRSVMHFDLSQSEQYNDEYQRLVKQICGEEIYPKPELGKRPAWVDGTSKVSAKSLSAFSFLKSNQTTQVKTEQFRIFLSEFGEKILSFVHEEDINDEENRAISAYTALIPLRDEYLQLIQYVSYIEKGEQYIANKFEDIANELYKNRNWIDHIKRTFLHELFIYTIAIYFKKENYDGLEYILGKTYFLTDYPNKSAKGYKIFYYSNNHLDNEVNKRDEKRYHSGQAQFWIENINIDICSNSEFIFADSLCYNYIVFGKEARDDWFWFPLSYVYDSRNYMLRLFATRLQSEERLVDVIKIFGYDSVEEFREKFHEVETDIKEGRFRVLRYSNAYENAPLICDYIKSGALGIYR